MEMHTKGGMDAIGLWAEDKKFSIRAHMDRASMLAKKQENRDKLEKLLNP